MSAMNERNNSDTEVKARRHAANDALREIHTDVRGYIGRCLFMVNDKGEFCNEPVPNRVHLVPESDVLKELRDGERDNILELQWGLREWRELTFSVDPEQLMKDPKTFEPAKRPTRNVCVGRFACKEPRWHDDEFAPIDVAQPNFDIPEVCLLTLLRLEQFRADQLNQACQLYARWNSRALSNARGRQLNLWTVEGAKLSEAYRSALPTVRLLGHNWYARATGGQFNPDMVSKRLLTFRSRIRLAGGVFYGGPTDVYVYPIHDDLHKMAILYLSSNSEVAQRHVARLEQAAARSEEDDGYGVTVTKKLMTRGWGVFAVSPKSYSELDDPDRTAIKRLVAQHSRATEVLQSTYQQPPRWQPRGGRDGDKLDHEISRIDRCRLRTGVQKTS